MSTFKRDENTTVSISDQHLGWSNKQKRILTGGDRAEEFYTAERGFAFAPTELPHHHLLQGDTHTPFRIWRQAMMCAAEDITPQQPQHLVPLVGAWTRLIFFGGWEHTSIKDERSFNLQTNNLFIDLRIPRSRARVLGISALTCLEDLATPEHLRLYARQHVFAGYTQVCKVSTIPQHLDDLVCTRHHCIDWNFVGTGRSRPNKWWAELGPTTTSASSPTAPITSMKTWKEWAFPTDDRGQHYYCEQWERVPGGDQTQVLALRTAKLNQQHQPQRDGIILIIGDHFNFIRSRDLSSLSNDKRRHYTDAHGSTIAVVEAALEQDDFDTARAYLSTQGGHGRISQGWKIDCAIEPWREGTALWTTTSKPAVIASPSTSSSLVDCQLEWNNEIWEVFDTTMASVEEIRTLIDDHANPHSML